nr:immunoglobulin light chain junction region [Macaca mulatta]MOV37148.1 immunoglobulin light chain junction region [Macaca mulatta]MOV37149.1 immunoglobulin light chain junction region [Macaca mulatta]MOV37173.1 immunoglobulin light chain junction region [Macaca mulatta]MOV37458.1 immunoglobulin light chain junction region [Macaca mulatta]
CMQTQETPLTF